VLEALDAGTGTTVVRLDAPVELIADAPAVRGTEPFAWLAPFETNRMGERHLYLWVATPQPASSMALRVRCGELVLAPEAPALTPAALSLSRMPYRNPAPWNVETLLPLPANWLECLAGSARLAIDLDDAAGGRYVDEARRSADLAQFRDRVSQ
jgi:hypothetical protein